MLKGKVMTILLINELIKKILLYQMSYFSEAYTHNKTKRKVQLDLSNYATKSDLENAAHVDTWKFVTNAALQKKMKFSILDFFSKCHQIHSFLLIWSH